MKLMLGLLGAAMGFSSAAQAGGYTCVFEVNQKVVNQCSIDSASPSTAVCSYPFPDTNLTVGCAVVAEGAEDLVACQMGVLEDRRAAPDLSKMVQSKTTAAALTALAQLPGFAAAAASMAPTSKATLHLGYFEKRGAPLLSAICPDTFAKR